MALPWRSSWACPPALGLFTSILTVPITAVLGRNPVLIGGTASATVPFIADEACRRNGLPGHGSGCLGDQRRRGRGHGWLLHAAGNLLEKSAAMPGLVARLRIRAVEPREADF